MSLYLSDYDMFFQLLFLKKCHKGMNIIVEIIFTIICTSKVTASQICVAAHLIFWIIKTTNILKYNIEICQTSWKDPVRAQESTAVWKLFYNFSNQAAHLCLHHFESMNQNFKSLILNLIFFIKTLNSFLYISSEHYRSYRIWATRKTVSPFTYPWKHSMPIIANSV